MTPPDGSYTAEHITVLKGLEPVRRRPGMYIGGTDIKGYHHLLWEIVDNSVDEVINGFATHIDVILHKDHKSVTVVDNGRGIPVDIKKEFNKSALELVLTVLHAGGKFSSGQYQYSGGLHGVGSSVVNALSEEMVARVKRDGFEWEQRYARGEVASKVTKLNAARGTGTSIFFRPDPQIFGKLDFSAETIRFRLETKTFLHKGLKITFRDELAGTSEDLQHDGGIADFLNKIVTERGKAPTTPQAFYFQREDGVRIEAALQWTESHEETLRSYVNGIPTPQGGAHEQGFRQAIVKAVRSFVDASGIAPKNLSLTAEDIREGIDRAVALAPDCLLFSFHGHHGLHRGAGERALVGLDRHDTLKSSSGLLPEGGYGRQKDRNARGERQKTTQIDHGHTPSII